MLIPPFDGTGKYGSVRTPRALCALQVSVPATQTIILDPARYRNGTDSPIFLERLVFTSGATGAAARSQMYLDMELVGVSRLNNMPIPSTIMPFWRTIGNNLISFWEFSRPFVLMPKTGLAVRISNYASSSAARTTVAFLGYSESVPAIQKETYLPYCISSTAIIAASTVADIPDEAMRNDSKYSFFANMFSYYPVGTSDNLLRAGNLARIRSVSSQPDIMLIRVDSRVLRSELSTTISSGIPLSGELPIGPEESASIEVESDTAETRHDIGLFGYKVIPL